jgi:hypothetical protein
MDRVEEEGRTVGHHTVEDVVAAMLHNTTETQILLRHHLQDLVAR